MTPHAKFYQRAAALLLCFSLVAMGAADIYAVCFSQAHAGGSAIHKPCGSAVHNGMHKMASAERQSNNQKCETDQYSHDNHCTDILLPHPAQNIQTHPTVQLPAIIDSGAFLDTDAMALFFTRRPAAASLFPAASPPVILQTQAFLN
jgi:hypothetical protein